MNKKTKSPPAPLGWLLAGSHPSQYEATLDTEIRHSGTRSCRVECVATKAAGWTTLMQNMGPKQYFNKRLKLTFWVRTDNVSYVAGWMRIDGTTDKMLGFDNSCRRQLKATNDWTKQEVILDVPEESTNIAFGIIFSGSGKMWADDFSFEIVDESVPVTSCPCSPQRLDKPPCNLDFESER